jgi:hypothetical protein
VIVERTAIAGEEKRDEAEPKYQQRHDSDQRTLNGTRCIELAMLVGDDANLHRHLADRLPA